MQNKAKLFYKEASPKAVQPNNQSSIITNQLKGEPNFYIQSINKTRKRCKIYPKLLSKKHQLLLKIHKKMRTFPNFLNPNTLKPLHNKDIQQYSHQSTLATPATTIDIRHTEKCKTNPIANFTLRQFPWVLRLGSCVFSTHPPTYDIRKNAKRTQFQTHRTYAHLAPRVTSHE